MSSGSSSINWAESVKWVKSSSRLRRVRWKSFYDGELVRGVSRGDPMLDGEGIQELLDGTVVELGAVVRGEVDWGEGEGTEK